MISRRVLLRNGGMALISLGFAPAFVTRTAAAGASRRKLLITIFQRGAADGLNIVVPFGERDYYTARPTIAIAQPGGGRDGGALDLDGFFGLHPRLAPLLPLWQQRSLAIVHACGSHDPTRSHFDAQDYMESGTPGVKSTTDGWLNRVLKAERRPDASPSSPFRAVALGPQLPRTLQGTAPALAMTDVNRFGVHGGAGTQASFEAEYAAAADRVLQRTGQDAFDAMRQLDAAAPGRYQPAERRRLPALRLRPGAPADRAAGQGRRRPRGRLRRIDAVGSPRQRRRRQRPARQPARRLRAGHRRAGHRPRLAHAGRRHPHHVRVRARRRRERQPRHRPRPRQRDVHRRRRGEGRQGLRPLARAGAGAASRGPRSRGHHRLPRRLQRGRGPPSRREGRERGVPRLRDQPGALSRASSAEPAVVAGAPSPAAVEAAASSSAGSRT